MSILRGSTSTANRRLAEAGTGLAPRARRTRLMQITHDLGLGGLERVIVTLLRTIDRSRFEPSILCLRRLGPMVDELKGLDIPIFQVPWTKGKPNYFAFREVARILRAQEVDVIHTHNTWAFVDGGLGALLAGVPTHIHTDHARTFPDRLRYIVLEHLLSYRAHKVVGVSQHTVDNLHRHEWISRRKLAVITNGIETDRFQFTIDKAAKRRELGLPPHGPVIGLNARLTPQKGITYLLQALPAVLRRFPDITVIIAGEGDLLSDLRAESEARGVAEHVRFLGLRPDVEELLQLYDVYVSPSLWEGLPMSLLEAMAAGCPIVASDVGGVPTALRHRVSGTLVPARDADALAAAIIELVGDPELRLRYAAAARKDAIEEFSAVAMTRRYERLYLRLPDSSLHAGVARASSPTLAPVPTGVPAPQHAARSD